jgi:hypothetical protein
MIEIDYAKYYESLSNSNYQQNGMDGEHDTEVFETIEDNRQPENVEVFEENNSGSGEDFEEDEDVPLVSGKKKKQFMLITILNSII